MDGPPSVCRVGPESERRAQQVLPGPLQCRGLHSGGHLDRISGVPDEWKHHCRCSNVSGVFKAREVDQNAKALGGHETHSGYDHRVVLLCPQCRGVARTGHIDVCDCGHESLLEPPIRWSTD